MDGTSIITQVTRDEEQITNYPSERGESNKNIAFSLLHLLMVSVTPISLG